MRVLFLLFTVCAFAKPTVCLNMIVKDEKPVIERALASVKPFIDYWVIVDTGSKDGTQKAIKEFMKGVPGELHERPWVNFGHNRGEAMKLAKGKSDYLLFIDADEVLQGSIDKNKLEKAAYLVNVRTSEESTLVFQRALLIDNRLDWKWKGVIHEKLECAQETPFELLTDVKLSATARDGHRSTDPQKFHKDAAMLEQALVDEPENPDYVFYLAQTYACAGEKAKALLNYKKRAAMNGWDQQTFWAKYCAASYAEEAGEKEEDFIHAYSDAFHARPTRAEPLYRICLHYHNKGNYLLGYIFSKFGIKMPKPDDIVFLEDWIYAYGMKAIYANCCLRLGKVDEALKAYEELIQCDQTPDAMKKEAITTKKNILAEKLFRDGQVKSQG